MKTKQQEWEQKARIGDKFGKWTVIGLPFPQTRKVDGATEWLVPCQCECGTYRPVRIVQLRRRKNPSCGECVGADSKSRRLYNIHRGMLMRCQNPTHRNYHLYGGRGISVDPAWVATFRTFKDWALSNGYEDGLQLDRIDNDGGYTPSNCRWVSAATNNRNKRANHLVAAFGEVKCLKDWVADSRCQMSYTGLRTRLVEGWSPEEAITTPPINGAERRWATRRTMLTAFGETKSIADWGRDPRCQVEKRQIVLRMRKFGWTAERAIATPLLRTKRKVTVDGS